MKKLLSIFLAALAVFAAVPVFAEETAALELTSPSAILIEASTGQILYEKNSHEKLPPASVTKIMTMLLAMEAIDSGQIKMDDMVRCSAFAAGMGGSQIYLKENEEMSVRDMLKAIAVASGNDAAAAMAEFIAGSHEGFVAMMNERAKELGMNDTHFVNCNGLDDPDHYTSAYDISLMSKELVSHPAIFDFTTIWMDSLRDGAFGLVNTNKLIRFYEGANGLKTGSTSVAKFCLSASAKRDGMNLIAVIMAAPTSKDRFADATKLLDYGFANYAIANSLVGDNDLAPLPVEKGTVSEVELKIPDGYNVLVSKAKLGSIEKIVTVPEKINAPVAAGEKIGEVEFRIDGEKIGGTDILAKSAVDRTNPFQMFAKMTRYLFYGE